MRISTDADERWLREDSDVGPRLGWTHIATLISALVIEAVAIRLSWGREPAWDTLVYAVYALANVVAGVLIVARHARHRIGLLLIATGFVQAVSDLGQGYALFGTSRGWPAAALVDLAASSSWAIGGGLMAATLVLFPDGRLPGAGRVWSWVLPLGSVSSVLLLAGWATGDQVASLLVAGTNPLRSQAVPSDLLYWLGLVGLTSSMLLGAVAMFVRMQRSSGVERQQLKWMVFAVTVVLVTLIPTAPLFADVVAVQIADALVLTAMPLAALAAIWRYRLYDIELIVSRTVLYLGVSIILGAFFAVLVVALGVVFGRGSAVVTALSTVAVALAFGPLRRRLQGHVDRWFDRGRYDAMTDIAGFMSGLRQGRREPEQVWAAIDDASARMRSPGARAAILPALQNEASLAIEMVRLRERLREQLHEVSQSRLRILVATETERRRIERDLHDGTQQRLLAIGLTLRHLQHAHPSAAASLDLVIREIADTIEELRDFARGIRPGILDDGLAPALRDLAHRSTLPVSVDVHGGRYARELETAAYFIACEGVANAVKHSGASHLAVDVRRCQDRLVIRVTDDGVGGAALREGGGLVGVSDRVAAHGGRLTIRSEPGHGTTLLAELACAS